MTDRILALASKIALGLLLVLVPVGFGMWIAHKDMRPYRFLTSIPEIITDFRVAVLKDPLFHKQMRTIEGNGVILNELSGSDDLVLIQGFFDGATGLRLVDRAGGVVAAWTTELYDYPLPLTGLNGPTSNYHVDTHGVLIKPDGSVVFNFEYYGTVKLDRCGAFQWTADNQGHHSVVSAERGGYWAAGRTHEIFGGTDLPLEPITRPDLRTVYFVDTIDLVSETGEVILRKDIHEILIDNGLEGLLVVAGVSGHEATHIDRELVHSNKITELPADMADAFPMFDAGDLMLSIRDYNLIFVVDPDDWQIKWHKVGPWKRQHDPEFNADGTITVFNNNTFRNILGPLQQRPAGYPRKSNIMRVDPVTNEVEIAFGDRPGETFLTVIRGKHQVMPDGGFLITEFEGGRVIQTNADREVVWVYLNGLDEDFVAEVTAAEAYPRDYFTVTDWSCD